MGGGGGGGGVQLIELCGDIGSRSKVRTRCVPSKEGCVRAVGLSSTGPVPYGLFLKLPRAASSATLPVNPQCIPLLTFSKMAPTITI